MAVDPELGIGYKNHLLFHSKKICPVFASTPWEISLSWEERHWRAFPEGAPLSGRTNIVLTRKGLAEQIKGSGCASEDTRTRLVPAGSLEEAQKLAESFPGKVYIIGGRDLRGISPLVSTAYITQFEGRGRADTFFPNLAADPEWGAGFCQRGIPGRRTFVPVLSL